MVALTKLELTQYYQGWKSVDEYIDEFLELVEEAGYSDSLSIIMKFQKGQDRNIQDRCHTSKWFRVSAWIFL